jgi:small subunit ribosomal protein S21
MTDGRKACPQSGTRNCPSARLTGFPADGKCGDTTICISGVVCYILALPALRVYSVVQFLQRRIFVVKLRLRDNESVNEAVRRFRKLVEHAGVKKEMRKREFYEKPSDIRRRDRRRAEMRARRANQPTELEMQ